MVMVRFRREFKKERKKAKGKGRENKPETKNTALRRDNIGLLKLARVALTLHPCRWN